MIDITELIDYHIGMKTKISIKLANFLKKDLSFIEFAIAMLRDEMAPYEKKYSMKWEEFIKKFEAGKLGDERHWFEWYGLALGTKDWYDTKKEIEKTIGTP